MIKITNGITTLRVTHGAFSNFYKRRGFHAVKGASAAAEDEMYTTHPEEENGEEQDSSQQESDEEEEDTEEPEEEEDLSEIPLSDLNKEQLRRYASQLGLEYDEGDSKKQLREMIKEHLGK